MPLQETSGAASYDAFGGGVPAVPNYIEDVFSTYLYTGNGTTQTITNNIDLSTKGGLVWVKSRSNAVSNILVDTVRGASNNLITDSTGAQTTGSAASVNSFNTTGFGVNGGSFTAVNFSGYTYASWSFRKQPKFFDVVTWTGNATSGRQIAHNLGSVPGFIIVKRTDAVRNWVCYHQSLGNGSMMILNSTAAVDSASALWNNTTPTSTYFTVNNDLDVNGSGATYVAYIFAHNAGGFGLTGTDNVITCGSYTGNGSTTGPTVTLGYEPQWVLIKKATGTADNWIMFDNMRGMPVGSSSDQWLFPNSSAAEATGNTFIAPTASGFYLESSNSLVNQAPQTYIYIAIRRGPMKVPTTGTSVFNSVARTGTGATANITTGFITDLVIETNTTKSSNNSTPVWDRLRGKGLSVYTNLTSIEDTSTDGLTGFDLMTGVSVGADINAFINASGANYINWNFRRAPSFCDVVCYTGTGSATTVSHNLGVAPELLIVKSRSGATAWIIYSSTLGNNANLSFTTAAVSTPSTAWNTTTPTSSVFSLGTSSAINGAGSTYVAYLFATCAGVSKVGSYTGTGATQTIACGFTGGARFVLIKRTDSTGDWYVWDTARGMVSGTDPSLLLNSTAAEVNANSIYTTTGGFQIVSTAAGINASGGTYIFLAIA